VNRRLDKDDIVSWGWNDDEFPLNQLQNMKFDASLPLPQQRTFFAAAVLLFYRRRTAEQERVFRDLSGVWAESRGSHITHTQLCSPPAAGACLYSPDEVKWCAAAQKALIAKMDTQHIKELEIPEPTPDRTLGSKRRSRGDALEGQDALLQSQR
jgi:hypothetical protein